MADRIPHSMSPDLDLMITRTLAATPTALYRCWTEPDLLKQWFCPPPYRVTRAKIDPRAGGIFHTVMQGPDGTLIEDTPGCVLAATPAQLFVFTDSMAPGLRPRSAGFMTGMIRFEAIEEGTLYTARVLHMSAEDRQSHLDMGFHTGWGIATEQLEALAKTL